MVWKNETNLKRIETRLRAHVRASFHAAFFFSAQKDVFKGIPNSFESFIKYSCPQFRGVEAW